MAANPREQPRTILQPPRHFVKIRGHLRPFVLKISRPSGAYHHFKPRLIKKLNPEALVGSRILDLVCAVLTAVAMPLYDPYAFQLAGFSEGDVDEILADLDYLHRNSRWTHRRDQIERMIVESPVILLDFLRSVQPEVVKSAMIPRRVKDLVFRSTPARQAV